MSTQKLLADFNRFAQAAISNAPYESIDELYQQWRQERELRELRDEIQAGLQDYQQGKCRPANEVMEDLRNTLGYSQWPSES